MKWATPQTVDIADYSWLIRVFFALIFEQIPKSERNTRAAWVFLSLTLHQEGTYASYILGRVGLSDRQREAASPGITTGGQVDGEERVNVVASHPRVYSGL